jgi:hypothetical protein
MGWPGLGLSDSGCEHVVFRYAVLNTVINFLVPYNAGKKICTSGGIVTFKKESTARRHLIQVQ